MTAAITDQPPSTLVAALPLILTVEQLAVLLQLPRSTTYEKLGTGEIPGKFRIGRHLRVRRDAVLTWRGAEEFERQRQE